MLQALLLASVLPFTKADLTIYYNPATSHGEAVKQQLTSDLTKLCKTWPSKERIMGLNAVVAHEYTRRRIHKYFNVKFVESSDKLSFRIGSGNRVSIPESTTRDPREYPGYIDFFDYVVNVHYRAYFNDIRKLANARIKANWRHDRSIKRSEFIFKLIDKGYEQYFDELSYDLIEEEFETIIYKDGKFFNLKQLGWEDPPPPKYLPELPTKLCPLNSGWKLPK